ncbi:molybdopterin-dependent oxidoreductase [Pelovirga terrestris]|uniref:Molybdopterin-dependent oxidoreductase n=1 Tax=Pelovirga terrestris TaxID=2771352 RepID=A0A8J6R5Y2_9BACT|nr:molybdopterin-dependent oxidoreductase [Pelovirga terrestris]MBD1400779.1 molybdopterin-dependent oxidoreductase [Pelovirga terrestris]
MVNLTIDGKSVSVPNGATILDAARQLNIHIPTLCWLKKISTTGACRICAVEIAGVDRPMTACNTPVKEGIVVTTQSEALTKARKQIMELILLNHPLDCPVCDAGGECDLQDTCFELGVNRQHFKSEDVNPPTIDHWPLIQQVPSRCVMCEKCVKVCHELVGADALFVNDKGDRAYIDKRVDHCIYCGNCVAVCPTGTMISKPFKFKARPWELCKTRSICTLCPSQCQIDVHVKNNEIYRITSDDDTTSNQGTLCIGGFFGYGYVNNTKRLTAPQISDKTVSWDEALGYLTKEIVRIKQDHGPAAIAGLSSPRLSNEENYLFQKLFRAAIGSNNIDSEARFGALRSLRALNKGIGLRGASNRLETIGRADAVLVFGADPSAEAPAVDWQIQNAVRRGDGKLIIANMRRIHLTRFANSQLTYQPGSDIELAQGLAKLLLESDLVDQDYLNLTVENLDELKSDLAGIDLDQVVSATGISLQQLQEAARMIGNATNVAVVFGGDIHRSINGVAKAAAICNLAIICGALRHEGGLFPLDEKGNTQGLLDMGIYPESLPGYQPYGKKKEAFEKAWGCTLPEGGLDADGILKEIEEGNIRLLYLAAVNPLSFPNSVRWLKALQQVEVLVVQDIFPSVTSGLAKVVLPGATFAEKEGSFTSLDQSVRPARQAVHPVGESRGDAVIFAELMGRLTQSSTLYSQHAVIQEIQSLTDLYQDISFTSKDWHSSLKQAWQVSDKSLVYQPISSRDEATGLQLLVGSSMAHFGTTSAFAPAICDVEPEGLLNISAEDAGEVAVRDGEKLKVTGATGASAVARVRISPNVPKGLIYASTNFSSTGIAGLLADGDNRTTVQVERA